MSDYSGGITLRSIHRSAPWPTDGPVEAFCEKHLRPPVPDCSCGLWGYQAPFDSAESMEGALKCLELAGRADLAYGPVGVVIGWGRFAWEGEAWRVQFAAPALLFSPPRWAFVTAATVDQLAAAYGVEVVG